MNHMSPRGVVVSGEPSIFEAGNPKLKQKLLWRRDGKLGVFLNSQPKVETLNLLSALNRGLNTFWQGLWMPLPEPLPHLLRASPASATHLPVTPRFFHEWA